MGKRVGKVDRCVGWNFNMNEISIRELKKLKKHPKN
jgi:hypothetical protein